MKRISTCLWFDGQGSEAAKFYTAIFSNQAHDKRETSGESDEHKVMAVDFLIDDHSILALNGGPQFKFTTSLSYFVTSSSPDEIDRLWQALAEGGKTRMALGTYPWSQKYGWTSDRFGVEWQLNLAEGGRKIAPALLFVNDLFGKGEEAVAYYTSIFPKSSVLTKTKDDSTGTLSHCRFDLNGQSIVLMEGQGRHDTHFTEAFSFVVSCSDQQEIDTYWSLLTAQGSEGRCGWLKDKYGVSWQIIPSALPKLMSNPQTSSAVQASLMTMKKIDLSILEKAAGVK